MKRTASAMVLLAALGGCVATESGTDHSPWSQAPTAGGCGPGGCGAGGCPPTIPGMQGPWGAPVGAQMPYAASPNSMPSGAAAARAMLNTNVPLELVQQAKFAPGTNPPSGIMQASYTGPAPAPAG